MRAERERMLATIDETFRRCAGRTGLERPDPRVRDAMARIPREQFVPPALERRAYDDSAVPIAWGQTISQPFVVALMSTLLHPMPHHRVLEVGSGSGYQAAVLAEVVHEVYTVEIQAELARAASAVLDELGYRNVHVHRSDGFHGWPEHAPYDGILVACGRESIPLALLEQLAPLGHLVMPIGPAGDQRLLDVTRDRGGTVRSRDVLGVRFVPFVRGG
jgi:protein-L-isoaspartate(D-aspartate) O-methyltransferase